MYHFITLFGPDTLYGLASVLMSLIETAPGWSLGDVLQDTANEWVVRLRTPGETSPALHCRSHSPSMCYNARYRRVLIK
jgi:hypothetical protein